MTENPPQTPHAPQQPAEAAPGAVGIDVQQIMDAYATELATITQRAIIAEAGLKVAQIELAQARQTIHALSPGAPTVQEN